MIKIISLILFAIILGFPAQGQLQGELKSFPNFESDYVENRRVDFWIPKYAEGPYSLLIMHDGQMLFQEDSTWNGQEWGVDECLDSLFAQDKIPAVLVVGIWNIKEHRHRNYFPQAPFESLEVDFKDSLLGKKRTGQEQALFSASPNSDDYLRFIFDEVLPYTQNHYEIEEAIYMMGSSMGGLISMYAALKYPKKLAGVACLSTHWPGIFTNANNPIPDAFIDYIGQHKKEAKKTLWYFDRGDATLDALYPPHQDRADALFRSWNLAEGQFESRTFPGAPHEETAWRERLPEIILHLLQTENSKG